MAKLEYPCGLPVIFHPSEPPRPVTGSPTLNCLHVKVKDEAKPQRRTGTKRRLVGQGPPAKPFTDNDRPCEVVFAWTPAGKQMIAGVDRRQFLKEHFPQYQY